MRVTGYQEIEDVLFRVNDALQFPDVSLATKMGALYHIRQFNMSVCLDRDTVVIVVVVVVVVVGEESDVMVVMDMPREFRTLSRNGRQTRAVITARPQHRG